MPAFSSGDHITAPESTSGDIAFWMEGLVSSGGGPELKCLCQTLGISVHFSALLLASRVTLTKGTLSFGWTTPINPDLSVSLFKYQHFEAWQTVPAGRVLITWVLPILFAKSDFYSDLHQYCKQNWKPSVYCKPLRFCSLFISRHLSMVHY